MEINSYLIRKLEESGGYYNQSFSNRYMNWKRRNSIIKSLHQELKKIKQEEKPIRILEIGCGDGWLIYRLKYEFDKAYRLEFTGVDISDFDIDFARRKKEYFNRRGCDFRVMDALNLGFNDQEFDIAISSELLEHILEPDKAVRQVYRVLKKGGLFILTTPNKGGSLPAKFLRLIKGGANADIKECPSYAIEESEISKVRLSSDQGVSGTGLGHVSVRSPKEWGEIFKKAGFKIISIKGTGGLFFGSPRFDNHRILFAFAVILDVLSEKLPLSYLWGENIFFELKKC